MSDVVLGNKATGEEIERYVDGKFCTCGEWVTMLRKDLELLADCLGYEFRNEPAKRTLVKKQTNKAMRGE